MEDIQPSAPAYPALNFIVKHGDWVATAAALTVLIGGIYLFYASTSVIAGIAGAIAAGFIYLLMRAFVELVRVIVDMLLPK